MLHYLYSLKKNFTMKTTKKTVLTSKWENPTLERLWDGQYLHISQQKVIVSHVINEILCNMRKFAHYT